VSSYPENKPLRTLRGHTAAVYCLAFSDRYSGVRQRRRAS
jgi:hypothetical protein